jgi:hypothetical protein
MVDNTSRNHHLVGLHDYTSDSVITAINEFTAPWNQPVTDEHINIIEVKTDAGYQLSSSNFREDFSTANIETSIAAPNHQYQNQKSEITWYSLHTIDDAMLVHVILPPKFPYNSILYAIEVFSVFPVKKLLNKAG